MRKIMLNVLETILNGILFILLPVEVYLMLVGIFIALDSYFRVWFSFKKKDFSLGLLLKGMLKKMWLYTPIVVSIFYLDTLALNEIVIRSINIDHLITRFVTGVIIFYELGSINKNIKLVTGKSFFLLAKTFFNFVVSFKQKIKDLNE